MSTISQIQPWIEKLPQSSVMIRIRVGDTSLQTVATIAIEGRGYRDTDSDFAAIWHTLEDLPDVITSSLEDNGYGDLYKKGRLHAYDVKGKSNSSRAITATHGRIATLSGADRAIEKLTEGLLAATAENRKVIAILAETLTHREDRMSEAIDAAMDSRADALDADAYSMALEMLNESPEEGNDPLKTQAATVLGQVANMFTGQQNQNQAPTKEQIRNWVSNPEFVKEMMQDPDIQADLYSAFMEGFPDEGDNPEDAPETDKPEI